MHLIIQRQTPELQSVIFKAPALITLYVASQVSTGNLEPSERKSAKIYLSILSNQGADELRDYFSEVKKTFDNDLNRLNKELPADSEKRKDEIEQRLKPVRKFIASLPSSLGIMFKDALLSIIMHSRNSNNDTLLNVVLPIISDELIKIEDKRMREIL